MHIKSKVARSNKEQHNGVVIKMQSPDQSSPDAAILWSSVSSDGRERILNAVGCASCRGGVKMIDFKGEAHNGDLILTGKCAKCGGEVVRRIESSELAAARN